MCFLSHLTNCHRSLGWGVRVQAPLVRAAGFELVAVGLRQDGGDKAEALAKSLGPSVRLTCVQSDSI